MILIALLWQQSALAQTTNGTCGTAANSCAVGTVTGSVNNGISTSWTCLGNGGSNAWCTIQDAASANVNGVCGTTPSTCSAGMVVGATDNGISTSWTCEGNNSGSNAWCSLTDVSTPSPINGTCGTAASTCSAGTVTGSNNNGITSTWTCDGSNNGSNAACSVADATTPPPINGACGTAASTCSVGTVTGSSNNGITTTWLCDGSNNGSNASCSVADAVATAGPVNGTCGSTPSTCSAGTVTGSTDNGISTSWTCAGGNNGSNAWCSLPDAALPKINGTCGPTPSTCSAGTVTGSSDNGISTSWTCAGSNSGSNTWCSVTDGATATPVNGTCGAAASTCTAGTVTGSNNNGTTTTWTCAGSNSGSNAACSVADAPSPVNGSCGVTASTCSAGTVTGTNNNGTTTTWSCTGSNNGTTAACSVADAVATAGPVNGTCGATPSTCSAGTVTGSTDNGISSSWTCLGSNSGTNAWCSLTDGGPAKVNGACGAVASSCSAGTVSGSSDNGISTSWSCLGSNSGSNTFCSVTDPLPVNGVCGAAASSCSAGTLTGSFNNGYVATWSCAGIASGTSAACNLPLNVSKAGTNLGVNLSWVLDYSDQEMMFVDVMKDARGFATPAYYYDPVNHPVPLDANGWPTTDFGVVFITSPNDPLGRPLSTTFPSFFGTYSLSFSGKATVTGTDCCTIQNLAYNAQTNTTTASVVVASTDTLLALTFTGTTTGVQNLKLLRPGYPLGTTQVFTTQFLNAIAPFSTLRLMDTLETNGNAVTTWAQRTPSSTPYQSALTGLAWEYVIALANATGKDIWVNIPEGVNLADPTTANYGTQLAQLMNATLNPGIHVYLEYSNELWNSGFTQYQANLNAATSDVNSGADPTLNYDNINIPAYWASRRAMHEIVRLSQLFKNVYGSAAMNTTIRPLFLSQYVQPYLVEDALLYLKSNFGAPNQYLYGIGGAPYFSGPASSYPDASSAIAGLAAGLPTTEAGFPTEPFTGAVSYTNLSFKGFADFYGLHSVSYEGGPGIGGATPAISEQAESSTTLTPLIEGYLGDWFGCGNGLFMYYELANAPGNIYGAYEDLSLPTPKSTALTAVAATPLSSFGTCSPP